MSDQKQANPIFQFSPHEIQVNLQEVHIDQSLSFFQFSPHEILKYLCVEGDTFKITFNSLLMRFAEPSEELLDELLYLSILSS